MSLAEPISFVVAVSNREIFERNLLASSCLCVDQNHPILVQEKFPSAARAYNDAIDCSTTDLMVFVHQDVFLPGSWLSQLKNALGYLAKKDPQWGVLGCWGVKEDAEGWGYIYSTGWGFLGHAFEQPTPVQTLDEVVLILRKSSGLRFDERLPHFHFYGTDICLTAAQRGLKSYAVSAFCIHNTQQLLRLPKEFYECYRHIKRVWKDHLPIQTPCIRISRFDREMYARRLKEFRWQTLGDRRSAAPPIKNPRQIVEELEATELAVVPPSMAK